MNDAIKKKMTADLKARKIDGMLTAEIAKRYRIKTNEAYLFMLALYLADFKADNGAMLARNSGTGDEEIRHTHWFFT